MWEIISFTRKEIAYKLSRNHSSCMNECSESLKIRPFGFRFFNIFLGAVLDKWPVISKTLWFLFWRGQLYFFFFLSFSLSSLIFRIIYFWLKSKSLIILLPGLLPEHHELTKLCCMMIHCSYNIPVPTNIAAQWQNCNVVNCSWVLFFYNGSHVWNAV